jgi:cytochrome b561
MPAALHRNVAAGRYTLIAIILHWTIALGVLALIFIGLTMTQLTLPPARLFQLYQLHKSIGITVLLAAMLRLIWRVRHRPPALPPEIPEVERRAAGTMHGLLYLFLLALPLTGWAMVSASPFNIPTVLYGLVPWPHLPILPGLHDKAPVEAVFRRIHTYGAWTLILLLTIHVGAALRHHFLLRDDVLSRMLPLFRRPSSARARSPR